MADFHSPTVIQPDLPVSAISPLEHLLLTGIFEYEIDGGLIFLFCELGFDTRPDVGIAALRDALARSEGFASQIVEPIRQVLASLEGPDDDDLISLGIADDFEDPLHLVILQDIVRRAEGIDCVTVSTAYTCTKMRPDGFGGRAALVTADLIRTRSTDDLIEEFMSEAKVGAQ